MPNVRRSLMGAAGNADSATYVEDVFSTYLYTGDGSNEVVNNGIDLDGEGGLVWIKNRGTGNATWNYLFDTVRDAGLYSNSTAAEFPKTGLLSSFNSDGFTVGSNSALLIESGKDFASWTFRKQAGFFDVVTWSGNNVQGREIAHDLAANVGTLIIKKTSNVQSWYVWHRSQPGKFGTLDTTTQFLTDTGTVFGDGSTAIAPTSDSFTVDTLLNESGDDYVAYLFAHDDQSFGDNSNESIIKCGSYTGSLTVDVEVDLGWEPQYLLIKRTDSAGNWTVADTMRGLAVDVGKDWFFRLNTTEAELDLGGDFNLTPTGFIRKAGGNSDVNTNGGTYIYMAIRRPMKTPESVSEVFAVDENTSASTTYDSGFPVDVAIMTWLSSTLDNITGTRLTSNNRYTVTNSTAAEQQSINLLGFDYMDKFRNDLGSNPSVCWMFKRAPGFMDVVCYEGTGTANTQIDHNLTVAPELIISKNRDSSQNWEVLCTAGSERRLALDTSNAAGSAIAFYWGDGTSYVAPTATQFTVGNQTPNNGSGNSILALLFATLDGISKVGSYTGTGSDVTVDCGFTNGAAFVLVKRTDSTGDWYLWDSTRGIVAGNAPYLLINTTAPEVTTTDYIDPDNSGFVITSGAPAALNASGGNYIFLAIAAE